MGGWIALQFRVRNRAVMARVAELFEQEAEELEDDETAVHWREMARICQQQIEGRRCKNRVHRPVLARVRPDVMKRVAYGPPPYDILSEEEAKEVCRLLTREGRKPAYIADRIMTHERTVSRWRSRDHDQNH